MGRRRTPGRESAAYARMPQQRGSVHSCATGCVVAVILQASRKVREWCIAACQAVAWLVVAVVVAVG